MEVNIWIAQHYEYAVSYARRFTDHPKDVVHDIFIKCEGKQADNCAAYVRRAIYNQVREGVYKMRTAEYIDQPYEGMEIERKLMKDKLDGVIMHMPEFDRMILRMYMEGECMKCVSRQSGIAYTTLRNHINDAIDTLYDTLRQEN